MGVHMLFSYIDKDRRTRNCRFSIDITKQVELYKKENPNIRPLLVVDALLFLGLFVDDKWDELTFGRSVKCIKRTESFCQRFKDLGVDLVFFWDGSIKPKKLDHVLNKLNTKYEELQVTLKEIRDQETISYRGGRKIGQQRSLLMQVTKRFATNIISLENDCDVDLAEYATRNHAMAVLSSDTDFLIMPSDWQIWTCHRFNLNNFTTVEWNKYNLRQQLNLQQAQMPVFATVLGNDFISGEVDKFRRAHKFVSLPGIAKFVRRTFPNGIEFQMNEFEKLVAIMNDGKTDVSLNETEANVISSLESYNYSKRVIGSNCPDWLMRHVTFTNEFVVHEIFCGLPTFVRQSFIDMSLTEFKPFWELVIPVIRRQMGAVFYEQRTNTPASKHTIYYKPSHEEPMKGESFAPIYPEPETFRVNSICDIVEYEGSTSPLSKTDKCKIYAWLVAMDSLVDTLIKHINTPFLVPALVLNHLCREKQITTDEADVMLLSLYESKNEKPEKLLALDPPDKINARCVYIAVAYNVLVEYFLESLVVAGLNEFKPKYCYDGFVFHKLYAKYPEIDYDERKKRLAPIAEFRIYV